jgi:putative nucleotidyltransferase with HDIG domain
MRDLVVAAASVLAANAVATYLSVGTFGSSSQAIVAVGTRSLVLAMGFLVSAYIAKSRSQDDLASDRGAYLHAILNCGARLTSFSDVHELALYILGAAVTETEAGGGELLLVNEETRDLECEAFHTVTGPGNENDVPSDGAIRSYANWVVGSGKEFSVQTGGRPAEEAGPESLERPVIAVPLHWLSSSSDSDSSVMGVLIVWGRPEENFASDAMDILRIFAAMAAAAIVNLRLYTNLQRSFLSTLQSLANGLEARDEYTRGHSDRVTQVSCMIAEELGVPGDSIDALRNAALLHDIGKIGVPDAILRKAGKLTAEEWETMRRHPVVSEEICRPLGLANEVLFLIKHHQERLDGKGYPAGLPAPEQPLLLRVLVVADSFDAMRSRRPYRDRMPEEELVAELNRGAGRTLDPTVVDALKRLMERGDLDVVYEEHDRMIGDVVWARRSARKAA